MRKLLAFIVLLILPLQLAFAAAAEYCDHAKADRGNHFGHHVHKAEKGKTGSEKKSGYEPECGFCGLGCSHAQPCEFHWDVPQQTAVATFASPVIPASNDPPAIDRPPRSALA